MIRITATVAARFALHAGTAACLLLLRLTAGRSQIGVEAHVAGLAAVVRRIGRDDPKVARARNMLPATALVFAEANVVAAGPNHSGKLLRQSGCAQLASKRYAFGRRLHADKRLTGLHGESSRAK